MKQVQLGSLRGRIGTARSYIQDWAASYIAMKTIVLAIILSATVLYAGTPPEFSVKLGGKPRSLIDIEQILKDHVVKQKLGFDFTGCKKRVSIDTEMPEGIEVFFTSRDGALALSGAIDKNAKVTRCNVVAVCGGAR